MYLPNFWNWSFNKILTKIYFEVKPFKVLKKIEQDIELTELIIIAF